MSREQLLASTFVELADTLTDDFDVLDFLQNLVTRSADLLGADAAGVILVDQRGDLQLIASTTHAAEVLGLMAIATQQGPCVEAVRTGRPLVNLPLDESRRRWPGFQQNTHDLGFHAVQVLPLHLRGEVLGALSLFYVGDDRLDQDDLAVGRALTAVTTIGLLQERTPRQKEILAQQLQTALSLRVLIEQAKGIVAELSGSGVEEAFALITSYSRTQHRSLSHVAGRLIDGSLRLEELQRGGSRPDHSV